MTLRLVPSAKSHRPRLPALLMGAGLAIAVIVAGPTAAATTVSTEAELRAAFSESGETQIDLTNDITLSDCAAGALQRNSATALTLDGHGFTIRQTCADRVINQEGAGQLTVRGVTITGGNTTGGGGGINANGDVTVNSSAILDNQAGNASGGGILAANVTVNASTVAGNSTTDAPGGGIAALNQTLVNSTVTSNTAGGASGLGGGLFTGNGVIVLVYTDVVGNTGNPGANINEFEGGAELISFGSVVAQPLGGGENCITGGATSQGFNFSDDDSCAFTESSDRQNAGDPLLGSLADNGGPTPTLLPQPGSPLVDAIPVADCQTGDAAGITTDQRGLPRPAMSGCDVGSVEVQPPAPPPPPVPPAPPAPPAGGAVVRFTG